MVSEGVDIPRRRVGVYATTTSTELFFRQAVGRLVRWTRGVPRQRSWLFIPDDPRLRRHAAGVAEQRRHSLRRRDVEPRVEGEQEREPGDEEQMSLFAALSAVATDASDPSGDYGDEPELDDGPNDEIELMLAPPPPLTGGDGVGTATLTRREEKNELRDANAKVARELVRRTRMTHGQVNAELNRLSKVRKVSEATIDELERRLVAADKWLAKT